jgi:hypothetical protein
VPRARVRPPAEVGRRRRITRPSRIAKAPRCGCQGWPGPLRPAKAARASILAVCLRCPPAPLPASSRGCVARASIAFPLTDLTRHDRAGAAPHAGARGFWSSGARNQTDLMQLQASSRAATCADTGPLNRCRFLDNRNPEYVQMCGNAHAKWHLMWRMASREPLRNDDIRDV